MLSTGSRVTRVIRPIAIACANIVAIAIGSSISSSVEGRAVVGRPIGVINRIVIVMSTLIVGGLFE